MSSHVDGVPVTDPGFPYTERRDGITRLCLPEENFDEGLYIHPESVEVLATTVLRAGCDPETVVFVHASSFMEVQKERDELKRTLSLINAQRARHEYGVERWEATVALLDKAGFTEDDARAMASLIAWATTERSTT